MATRIKRQTNLLHDTTTGTVNIGHGGSSKPQNSGFFGSGFTNTGSSSRKRRRRRQQALARQRAAQARAKAEAKLAAEQRAQELAHALAEKQYELEQRAKAETAVRIHAEAVVRAQAEKEQVYRSTIRMLTESFNTEIQNMARHYAATSASLPNSLLLEVNSSLPDVAPQSEQQVLDLIFQEKVRINYLIAMKSAERDAKNSAIAASGLGADGPSPEHYRHFLENQSNGNADLAHQLHHRWIDTYTQINESQLLSQSIALLEKRSTALSTQHGELLHAARSAQEASESTSAQHAINLWKAIAIPAFPATTVATDSVQAKVAQLAKEQFFRIASRALTRHAGLALAAYAPMLGDAERPPSVVGTPLSQLNLPGTLDLDYVAGVRGSIDVPHRLVESNAGERSSLKWTKADGVKLGTKVRVRTFTYNTQNNTYEFIRDGETTPALVWTPISRPADSSTITPTSAPILPADPGSAVIPLVPELEAYPVIDRNDPDDYILVSPIDSGLPDTYLLFKDPRSVPGVASGYGAPVTAKWLEETARDQGSPIPSSIAEKLRGQNFSSFDGLRRAIWSAVSGDAELSSHLGEPSLRELSKSRAPYVPEAGRVGKRIKFEVHHKHLIRDGGAVYDMDNLIILTPKDHIHIHRELMP